ncbi:TPA: coiled-coil domain-containing protein [Enterococcus faecium]
MASSLYNLALDFSKELNYTKAIMARQGDKGITVTVKPYLNGLQMDTSGGTFTLKGTTPSNRYVDSVATSVTSEEVTFSLDGTFMSEAGYYKHCYVEYRKDNQILTTQDIIFFSLGVSDISQGQADEYVSQLEELIRKYNETFDAFMAEIEGRVDSLNQQITDLTGQAKTLQDKLDALKEEISKLGNLQVMYSNSIDFGDYDYSGNPNLMSKLKSPDFNSGIHGSITDVNGMLHFTSDGTGSISMFTRINTPQLASGKTYTMSAKVRFDEGTTGAIDKLRLVYRTSPGEKILLEANSTNITTDDVGKEITIKGTANVNYQITNVERFYMTVSFANFDKINGGFKLYDIKIEEGSTATPYQPNLLVEPYNMCREYPNENIADPKVKFPIESGDYPIYQGYTEEELMIGQTYTITLKGTKPASQTFVAYNHWTARLGELKPVDGLTDVWSLTFTPTNVVAMPKLFRVYQYPQSTVGACQIDWLKIEKGNTRTPNISEYKYRGTGMRDSNNPKDYVWDLAPEYVEDNLATDIKISEITGKANNYTDGKVSKINSQLTASINEVDTTAKGAQTKANANATAIDELDNKIDERINDTATTAFYGAQGEVSNKTKVAEYGVGTGYTTTAVGETHFERQSNGYVKCLKAGKYSISAQIRVQLGGKYASWLYTDLYKDGTSVDNLVSYGVDALQNRFAASGNIVTDLEVNDVLNMRTEIGVANGILQFTSCRTLVLTRLSD